MKMASLRKYSLVLNDIMPLMLDILADGNSVKFSPNGTSMLPMLRQGTDAVVLSPIPEKLHKYDIVLYRRDNGQYVLHRIVKTGDSYICIGDNQFVFEPGLRRDQMIARVTSFYRDGREISVAAPIYQLYCRIWYYSRPFRHFCCRGIGWVRRKL